VKEVSVSKRKQTSYGIGTNAVAKEGGERERYTIKATSVTLTNFVTITHYLQSSYKETYYWAAHHEVQRCTRSPYNQRAFILHSIELFMTQPGELRKQQRTKRNKIKSPKRTQLQSSVGGL
jgi:hypothetical protein